jgi:hypothetical protein
MSAFHSRSSGRTKAALGAESRADSAEGASVQIINPCGREGYCTSYGRESAAN